LKIQTQILYLTNTQLMSVTQTPLIIEGFRILFDKNDRSNVSILILILMVIDILNNDYLNIKSIIKIFFNPF